MSREQPADLRVNYAQSLHRRGEAAVIDDIRRYLSSYRLRRRLARRGVTLSGDAHLFEVEFRGEAIISPWCRLVGGDDVWIAAGAVVLRGVTIGNGAAVGAA